VGSGVGDVPPTRRRSFPRFRRYVASPGEVAADVADRVAAGWPESSARSKLLRFLGEDRGQARLSRSGGVVGSPASEASSYRRFPPAAGWHSIRSAPMTLFWRREMQRRRHRDCV